MARHRQAVVAALLFDRLVTNDEPGEDFQVRTAPSQTYDRDALGDSIAEQLRWLLNTRVPVDYATLDARTRAGLRTTVDYGLPDLTVYPVGDPDSRARLHRHLAETVALYEPRLEHPQVTLAPLETRSETLEITVSGIIRLAGIASPLTMTFQVDAEKGAGHAG